MGLGERFSRVVRANLNDLVSKAEDPEKILEQSIIDMQANLVKLRTAVASAIAEQKRTEQLVNQNAGEAQKWEQRAKLALSKGDETLAREALGQKKTYASTHETLKVALTSQTTVVTKLRGDLQALESKISEAKTKKNMLIARAKAAKANEELQRTIGSINVNSDMSAFDRMEEKVLQLEAQSQAAGELGGFGDENQWKQLEVGNDVEDELAMLKAQVSVEALPPASNSGDRLLPSHTEPIDAELVDLQGLQVNVTINRQKQETSDPVDERKLEDLFGNL